MGRSDVSADRVESLRRWLFWVLVLGLAGTETELLLLEHYEDPWQFIPLVLIACAIAVLVWHSRRSDAGSVRAMQILMGLFVLAGFIGVTLHFRGAAEFQRESDPAMGTWDLVKKVMRAKAPPVLAPGVMLQLGLIGWAYAAASSAAGSRRREGDQTVDAAGR
jgi:hypothetical protein